MSSESKSFSKPDQEFTQFNNAHMVHVNVGGQRVIKITLKPGGNGPMMLNHKLVQTAARQHILE